MVEANPVKFYFAKYFFLAFCVLQWTVSATILMSFPFTPKTFFVSLALFTIGMVFLIAFYIVTGKIRRVSVGKNKIVILEGDRNMRFEWPEVKSLKVIPFFNLYKLRIKGKKKTIYFFPSHNIDPTFGLLTKDTSPMGNVVAKRKKEFNIK